MDLNPRPLAPEASAPRYGSWYCRSSGLFGLFSDARLKKDLKPIGTDPLPGVPIYEFSFISDPDGTRHIGPMAQDLQAVMPDAIYEGPDGYLRIDTQKYEELLRLKRFNVGMLAPN